MTDTNTEQVLAERVIVNGINGSTGQYLIPDMTGQELLGYISQEEAPAADTQAKLAEKASRQEEGHFGPVYGVDPKDLTQTGWGIIYGQSITEAVKEALKPLVNFRRAQVNSDQFFKEYDYFGQECYDFLDEHSVSIVGAANPTEMPYYLLLVGGPADIPYKFQYELDVDRAVGRLYFDTVAEYANYAASVVAAETGQVRLPRRASFFGVANPGDLATQLSTDLLVEPLSRKFSAERGDAGQPLPWEVNAYLRQAAGRDQLARLLGGDAAETPALLFTASHGVGFNQDDRRQLAHQGALVCADWDGSAGRLDEKVYFAGEHIASDARLHGLIGFFFACYGGGTPRYDEFMGKVEGQPTPIAPRPFVAGLPRRMLGHPNGGALAVIGHVERAWTYSFKLGGADAAHRGDFESVLGKLFDGFPIGDAFDFFNARHASASSQLVGLLQKQRRRQDFSKIQLIKMWSVNNDARDYIILGDPAVRLCVPESEADALTPSAIQLQPVEPAAFQPGSTPAPEAPAAPEGHIPRRSGRAPAAPGEAESMALISDAQKDQIKTALKNISQRVAQTLNNLGTLEVLTYLSDDDLDNVYDPVEKKFSPQAKLKAVTLISLDGDIKSMVPARQVETLDEENRLVSAVEVDDKLIEIHKNMVDLAQANRATFFKNLAEVAATLVNTRLT